jgi:hypothetical protein
MECDHPDGNGNNIAMSLGTIPAALIIGNTPAHAIALNTFLDALEYGEVNCQEHGRWHCLPVNSHCLSTLRAEDVN